MAKDAMPILVLLLVVVAAWIAFGVYFGSGSLDIDPNTNAYIKNINPSFLRDGFDDTIERTEELPVSVEEFLSINDSGQEAN